jgi:cellulose synthase/poly-beta-1,6-N-acetylglucosamine synthase-like glycosyltransferase
MVPVYRVPKRVGDIVGKVLADQWQDKDVVIVVDGFTTPEIEAALDPFRDRITIRYNGCQLGKATSINRAALSGETDVFLMLDNDIELPENVLFLTSLAEYMEDHDLAEIPKEALGEGLIPRMMRFEFLTNAMLSMTMSRCAGLSPSMNGAAFAVKANLFRELDGFRGVVNEDMDFAARAFELKASFGFPEKLKVRNEVPETTHDWFVQRKRWAMNNIAWLRDHWKLLASNVVRTPALILSAVLLILPFLTYLAVFFLVRNADFSLLVPVVFLTSQPIQLLTGSLIHRDVLPLFSPGGWIATFIGLGAAGLVFFVFSRVLKFRFNPGDFLLFYFVYSPIWLLSNVLMFFAVLLRIDVKIDWKISSPLVSPNRTRGHRADSRRHRLARPPEFFHRP